MPPYEDRATATGVTRIENLVKFGYVVSEICEQTDEQTYTFIAILCHLTHARRFRGAQMMVCRSDWGCGQSGLGTHGTSNNAIADARLRPRPLLFLVNHVTVSTSDTEVIYYACTSAINLQRAKL